MPLINLDLPQMNLCMIMGLPRSKGTTQLNGVTNNILQLLIILGFPAFRNLGHHLSLRGNKKKEDNWKLRTPE